MSNYSLSIPDNEIELSITRENKDYPETIQMDRILDTRCYLLNANPEGKFL